MRREPENDGLEYWVTQLQRGMSEGDVLAAFVQSKEFMDKTRVPMWVPPGHFYSPIVDPHVVREYYDRSWGCGDIGDIDIDINLMRKFWFDNIESFSNIKFDEVRGRGRYFSDNPTFSYADGIVLRAMIHALKPKRIIEIGSGFSTACMLDTRDELKVGEWFELTCIEPYPELLMSLLRPADAENVRVLESMVQSVTIDEFKELVDGDILFIDSTHVMKTGSDVHYELFSILPALASGVVVHFHDIFRGFEYPPDWVLNKNFSWNECYVIRALLMSGRYQVIFFNDMFGLSQRELIEQTCPMYLKNTGGSLWLRKL